MKHAFYDYDTDKALNLARNLIHGPLPPPSAPTPSIEVALEALEKERQSVGFNWITGRVACEVLRAELGHKNPFTT